MSLGRGEWRIIARSSEQLARCLDVSPQAVAKAEAAGRITREPDGRWEALAVVRQWRATVDRWKQRAVSALVDPGEELDVTTLVRRARYAGARVEYRMAGEAWHEHRDPVRRILVDAEPLGDPLCDAEAMLDAGELNALVPMAWYWLTFAASEAPALASILGVGDDQARDALDAAVRFWAHCAVAVAEEARLGPASPEQRRHGRVTLAECVGQGNARRGVSRPVIAGEAVRAEPSARPGASVASQLPTSSIQRPPP